MEKSMINRRHFMRTMSVSAASLSMLSIGCNRTNKNKKPLNIILIMGDDCSAREIGCYGHKEHKTPNIDKLAKTGVMFETCWCTPICSPTRAEIMTGRYGFRTGWYHNNLKKREPLTKENTIFSQIVKSVGYKTAVAGKWQLPGMPWDYGFDEHQLWAYTHYLPKGTEYISGYDTTDPNAYNWGYPARYWHPSILRNKEYIPTQPDDYGPDMHTGFLIDFITRHQDEPFLAYYPMILTHDPFYPTPDTLKDPADKMVNSKSANFKANVEYMDKCVGRLAQALEDLGLRENTVILFTTDNGTGGVAKNKPTELGCRVPMVVNCPGVVKPLGKRPELIDFSDVSPTLAELAGTTMPDGYVHDGKSFAPLLVGEPYEEREWIFSYLMYDRMLRTKRWLLEGDGRFYDCGDSRDGTGYKDVTNSTDPEVLDARKRFDEILADKPAPTRKE
jgi:arylsulfatase A